MLRIYAIRNAFIDREKPAADCRLRWLLALNRSQFNPERAAASRFGLHAHSAAHSLDDLSNNGQSNTGSFVLIVELLKHSEQSALRIGGNTDAIILDKDAGHSVTFFGPHAHLWPSA